MDNLLLSDAESLQKVALALIELFEDGACMVVTDLNQVTFKQKSTKFDVPGTDVGVPNQKGGVADQILKAGKLFHADVDGARYGIAEVGFKVGVVGYPVVNEEGEAVGTWLMAYPQRHPMVKSFTMLGEMIDEIMKGRMNFYLTDKNKIIDTTKYLTTTYSNIASVQPGAELTSDGAAGVAISKKMTVDVKIPRSVFGVACEIAAYPLIVNEDAIGTLCLVIDRELNDKVKEQINMLKDSIQQIAAAVEEVAASVTEVSSQQNQLSMQVEKIAVASGEIESVSGFIKEVADETKMLGLNASIEAARAGEAGRGFSVVAEEIRKLSEQSKHTVAEIVNFIGEIRGQIEMASEVASKTQATAEQQAAATQEINASIEDISALSEALAQAAENL